MRGEFHPTRRWAIVAGGSAVLASCTPVQKAAPGPTIFFFPPPSSPRVVTDVAPPRAVVRAYENQPLYWFDQSGSPTSKGRNLYQLLYAATSDGLYAGHYLTADLIEVGALNSTDTVSLRATDQALTTGLYYYARDLTEGRYNPNPSGDDTIFKMGLEASSILTWYRDAQPAGRSYQALKKYLRDDSISEKRASLIALNLERLRWAPEGNWSQHPNIRVNIAAAEVEAFDGRRLEQTMRGVLGRVDRQTPRLVSPVLDLKFSPDWTIPDTIMQRDYIPLLVENPDALDPEVYQVLVRDGPARKIYDWTKISAEDVFIRRASSDAGPLGGVRFSMYNSNDIFLHDTPHKDLFSLDQRFYSSGCVRLERAEDLAVWVLSKQLRRTPRKEIAERMRAGETSEILLDRRIEVSLQYMTIWEDGSGRLRMAPDVYELDAALADQMGLQLMDFTD